METNDDDLRKMLLEQQDLVAFYSVNPDSRVGDMYSKEHEISYYGLSGYILKDMELLKQFSTDNLIKMLMATRTDDEKTQNDLTDIIMERLEKEDFFCEEIDRDYCLKPLYFTNKLFSILAKKQDNIEQIRQNVVKRLQATKGTPVENIASTFNSISDAANFLRYFEQGVFSQEKIDCLEEMISEDDKSLEFVNFGLFQDSIYNIGPDFVKYMSKFPALSAQLVILEKNNPDLLNVLSTKVKSYDNLPDSYDEINTLITYLTSECYNIKLNSIDENVIDDISNCAILSEKARLDRNIITVEYGENYQERLVAEYDKRFNASKTADEKLNVLLNKRFAMSIQEVKMLIEEYGSDLENLNISEEEKKIFSDITHILDIKEESQIDDMYNEQCTLYKATDILHLKQKVAKECALSYTETMQETDNSIRDTLENDETMQVIDVNGNKVRQISLKGNFDLLVHSTDSGFIRDQTRDENRDFSKDWSRGSDKANHIISTSFINQDFLGCAPVFENGVMYGFTNIDTEKIRLMGVTDINTYSRNFAYDSKTKKYMSAKTMPYSSRRVYNEFGVERQDVTPDYVILFDDMSEEVRQNAYNAASQFDIPVLYIDKKEIEKQQIENLQELINNFKTNNDPEILRQILNTYETNLAGWLLNRSGKEEDQTFTQTIDNSRFKEDFQDVWADINSIINGYIDNAVDKKEVGDLTQIMQIVLEEMELYRDCELDTPITKTSISFDAKEILGRVNEGLDSLGVEQYKVDLENIPKLSEYQIKMKDIIKNALSGEDKITSEDIIEAENDRQAVQEMREESSYDDK